MGPDNRGLELLDVLSIVSFAMQINNYRALRAQASTDDIFTELQRQDNEFLARILENQEIILKKLSEMNAN